MSAAPAGQPARDAQVLADLDAQAVIGTLARAGLVVPAGDLQPLRDLHVACTYCAECQEPWPCESDRLLSAVPVRPSVIPTRRQVSAMNIPNLEIEMVADCPLCGTSASSDGTSWWCETKGCGGATWDHDGKQGWSMYGAAPLDRP